MLNVIIELCRENYRFYKKLKADGDSDRANEYWIQYYAYAYLLEDKLGYHIEPNTEDVFKVTDLRTGEVVYCK